jgi:hypothetical protein
MFCGLMDLLLGPSHAYLFEVGLAISHGLNGHQ